MNFLGKSLPAIHPSTCCQRKVFSYSVIGMNSFHGYSCGSGRISAAMMSWDTYTYVCHHQLAIIMTQKCGEKGTTDASCVAWPNVEDQHLAAGPKPTATATNKQKILSFLILDFTKYLVFYLFQISMSRWQFIFIVWSLPPPSGSCCSIRLYLELFVVFLIF